MWPRGDLLELLGIEHPIIQAPMAGSTTPALAAAVANAGGLGSLGCSIMAADAIASEAGALRAATNRPFNFNFFAHGEPQADAAIERRTRERVAPFYAELGLGEPPASLAPPFGGFDQAKLEAVLEIKPAVVSFHFGLPEPDLVAPLRDAGCRILCSATTVAEARALEDAGVDAVIAQGFEAGGHPGAFDVTFEDVGVGVIALVPQIVDAVHVPVIAAGGIADGRGIAAAFALGASGVQMGSAFLSCPESSISDAHRAALAGAGDQDTRLSRAISGRPARGRNTRFMAAMAESREPLPAFPLMYGLSAPLKKAGLAQGTADFEVLLYGQAAALNRALPAAELVALLVDEARAVFAAC